MSAESKGYNCVVLLHKPATEGLTIEHAETSESIEGKKVFFCYISPDRVDEVRNNSLVSIVGPMRPIFDG